MPLGVPSRDGGSARTDSAGAAAYRAEQRRDFGQRLRRLREDAGLIQTGLAGKLNAGKTWISEIERGEYELAPDRGRLLDWIKTCIDSLRVDKAVKQERGIELHKRLDVLIAAHEDATRRKRKPSSDPLADYLDHVRNRWEYLDLSIASGLPPPSGAERPTMAGQFIEPRLTPADSGRDGVHDPILATAILDRGPVSAIVGEPGTGKSALLQYIAWAAAGGRPSFPRRMVPFLVPVHDLANRNWNTDTGPFPVSYVVQDAEAAGLDLTEELVHELFAKGECLFLIDGLDEADLATAKQLFKRLKYLAINIRMQAPDNRLIMSTRPAQRGALADLQPESYDLNGFSWSDVEHFALKWDRGTPAPAARRRSSLLDSVRDSRVRRLMSRPLYLTIIALLHDRERGRLVIEQRDDIFRNLTEQMLLRDSVKGVTHLAATAKARTTQYRIENMALWIQQQPDRNTDAAMGADEMRRRLEAYLVSAEELRSGQAADEAAAFLEWSVSRSGVIALERKAYVFQHEAIQQYLASRAIYGSCEDSDDLAGSLTRVVVSRAHHPRWTEVVFFLASRMLRNQASRVVAAVRTAQVEYQQLIRRNVFAAVRVMAECHDVSSDVRRETLQAFWAELDPAQAQLSSGIRKRVYRESLLALPALRGTHAEDEMAAWLIERTGPRYPHLRARCTELLGVLGTGSDDVVRTLFGLMDGDADSTVQDNARRALTNICRFQESVIGELEVLAANGEASLTSRAHAARALMQLHHRFDLTVQVGLVPAWKHGRARHFARDWLRAVREAATDPYSTWDADREAVRAFLDDAPPEMSKLVMLMDEAFTRAEVPARHKSRLALTGPEDPALSSNVFAGEVWVFYAHDRAGVVSLVYPVRVGSRIQVRSPDSRGRTGQPAEFTQTVTSMEIEKVKIDAASPGMLVAIQFDHPVRDGDLVSVIEPD